MINVKGGDGIDTLNAILATANLAINLTTQYKDFENIIGGSGKDSLTGNSLANVLIGGAGDDTLAGGAGADSIGGGAGKDTIIYDVADTTGNVAGGADIDALTSLMTTAVTVDLGEYIELENLTSGSGSDTLTGSAAANIILGGNGDATNGAEWIPLAP
jgi:Ca2+-binding RTX toxin-like protein